MPTMPTAPPPESLSAPRRPPGTPPSAGDSRGVGESKPPDTMKEAANKFEKALVRQFVKVMTKDMFSGSHAGEGGGKWMQSQRDRQRDMMTDMISDRLAEADTLEVSEKLAKKWGIEDSGDGPSGNATPIDSGAPVPLDTTDPPRSLPETPTPPQDTPHIDHAV